MRLQRSRGFTYLGLIILVAIIGLVGAAAIKMGTLMQRAAAEEELLEIGAQFSEALRSYAAATPQGQKLQPPTLQDLLKDPRFPNTRRHLRKIFVDPVTGKAEWGVIYLQDKIGVIGVYSLSERHPLKIANFDIRFQNMENREKISDWKFLMAGGAGVNPAVLTPPNSMVGQPSLFAPGAPGTPLTPGGKAGPGTPEAGKDSNPAPGQPEQPAPPPPPPKDAPSDEEKAEDEEVAAPVDEEKEKEEDKESGKGRDADATAKPPEPSQYVPIVPPPVVRKRQ